MSPTTRPDPTARSIIPGTSAPRGATNRGKYTLVMSGALPTRLPVVAVTVDEMYNQVRKPTSAKTM